MNNKRADFLFATPCATFGVARFLDFGSAFDAYNGSATELEADTKAMFADWRSVRDSLDEALKTVDLG
jgi:hypothetical protein